MEDIETRSVVTSPNTDLNAEPAADVVLEQTPPIPLFHQEEPGASSVLVLVLVLIWCYASTT